MNFNHCCIQVASIPVLREQKFTTEIDGCPKRVVRRVSQSVSTNSLSYLESLPKVDDDELEIAIDSGSPLTPVNSKVMQKDRYEEYDVAKLKKKVSSANQNDTTTKEEDQPF